MQITPMRGPGTTILVVDDDALITLNTADILKELGHTAIEAFSAHEALTLMQRRSDIDVLITDYAMPGMTGLELAEAVRALRPGMPVLLTTGYSDVPEGQSFDYPWLEKPYREEDLTVRLAELLAPMAE